MVLESHLKRCRDISLGINKSQRAHINTVSHVVDLLLPISGLLFHMALMVFPSKTGYGLSELTTVSGALITVSGACRLRDVIYLFFGGVRNQIIFGTSIRALCAVKEFQLQRGS